MTEAHELRIVDLRAAVHGKQILNGIDLVVRSVRSTR